MCMQSNRDIALNLIIHWEGPEVNRSPQEPGGISKYGISLTTYAEYMQKLGRPKPTADDIANLTEDHARSFYADVFLSAIRFDDLPTGVDIRLIDISVNLGITGGINALEMVMAQYPLTGRISDQLLKLVNNYDPKAVVLALSAAWIANKHTKDSWKTNGHGWSNRNADMTAQCLKLIGG